MSHTAVVKFAPIFTRERFDNPTWTRPGRIMYDPGALTFLPGKTTVPLLVDHDDTRQIGTVNALRRIDWTDGPWIYASATVDDFPSWLKRGTPASFEFKALHRREVDIRGTRAEIVARAFVEEVSVLSPAKGPAEPLAEVLSICEREEPSPAGIDIYHPPGGVLVRRNMGEVLGVR